MKATCPKCGRTLHIWNWKQDCPSCGVNLIGYDLQARLERDADQAEAEFAAVQPYFDRAKASYIGSKQTIARLCSSILPLFAPLLPLANVAGKRVNVVALIRWIVVSFRNSRTFAVDGTVLPDRTLLLALVPTALLALTYLYLLAHLGFIAGSCSRPGRLRLFDLDLRILLAAGTALAVLSRLVRALPAAATVGVGAYVFLLLLMTSAAFDVALMKIGIPVVYKTCYIRGIPAQEYCERQKQTQT